MWLRSFNQNVYSHSSTTLLRQLRLSKYTCLWENQIIGQSMSHPGTIGGAVPISTSGISYMVYMIITQTICTMTLLLAVIFEEKTQPPPSFDFWLTAPGKTSRACAERKIRIQSDRTYTCMNNATIIRIISVFQSDYEKSDPVWFQSD